MYNILSPDGFGITPEPFKTKKQAISYFEQWKNRYQAQGYYSQTCYNGYVRHIPLGCLADYCELIKV